jgi:hypothetical protein
VPSIVALVLAFQRDEHLGLSVWILVLVVWRAGRILAEGQESIGRAVGWLLAGIVVVDAVAISERSTLASFCFVLSMPLLLLWQRKIAAT